MKYAVIYADSEGNSHFRDIDVEFDLINFAPPAPPVCLSGFLPASQFVYFKIPAGWFGDWHPAPKRQFFCCLTGEVEVTTTDGERRVFAPGDVFLLEDTTGKGHQTKVMGAEDYVAAITQLVAVSP